MGRHDGDRRVELYLRGDTYGTYERQQAILDRVRALLEGDVVAETSVETDWQRVRTPEHDGRDGALATVAEFETWAVENGFSLEPAFERRQRSFLGLEEVREVVVFPIASLAVYHGPDLQAVFPCADGEITYSVQDCLDAFEDGTVEEWLERFAAVSVDRSGPRLDAAVPA
jgi:hypothetical protein